jgi:hypothetical protein
MWYNASTTLPAGSYRPATSWMHYTRSCKTQSIAPEDGQNNCPKHVQLIGIINKPLLLHLVSLYYLYQWCTVKKISNLINKRLDSTGETCYKQRTTTIPSTVHFRKTADEAHGRLYSSYCLHNTSQPLQLLHDSLHLPQWKCFRYSRPYYTYSMEQSPSWEANRVCS